MVQFLFRIQEKNLNRKYDVSQSFFDLIIGELRTRMKSIVEYETLNLLYQFFQRLFFPFCFKNLSQLNKKMSKVLC